MIVSPYKLNYALDEAGDQQLYCTVGNQHVLIWRHMLKPAVLKEKTRKTAIDQTWLKYVVVLAALVLGVFAYLQYKKCSALYEKCSIALCVKS